ELRLDEDLGPIQTGNADALADLALVEVRRGGVDQTVTDAQCLGHGGSGFLRWGLEDTETECGDRRSTGESWFTPPPVSFSLCWSRTPATLASNSRSSPPTDEPILRTIPERRTA